MQIKTSQEFKSQAAKAIAAIFLFFLTYLLMIALAVGLTALCVVIALYIVLNAPRVLLLFLGLGLVSLGVLVLIFLLKFMFTSRKTDRSGLVEIKRKDEPQLFKLIEEIVKAVGTSFPKKVYLSSDVNASVFFDSNFWSMFFPVRKNLIIGMGLVNAISQSELKAILGHEFGHFSQKSMKVGSYVYNLNQIIFNLLYENDGYNKMAASWAESSGFFQIFVIIALKITDGIKYILKVMYNILNKSYMALSREMEFHADEIAANITGYEPLQNSLLRTGLANHSLNSVFNYYSGKIDENVQAENIYSNQKFIMNFLAKENNIPIENDLPQVSENEQRKFNKSKLEIKDQWASHPSNEDRIEKLKATGLSADALNDHLANDLFSNIEQTQKQLTRMIFENIDYQGTCSFISQADFAKEFENQFEENTFPKIYNGYYDNKNPAIFEINSVGEPGEELSISRLFSAEKIELVYTALSLQNDLDTISQIITKNLQVKTYDYDGQRYRFQDSGDLHSKLSKELDELKDQILKNDIKIFQYFRQIEARNNAPAVLEDLYREYFDFDSEIDKKNEVYLKIIDKLQFTHVVTPFDQIIANFREIRPLEDELKEEIKEVLNNSLYESEITKDIKSNFEQYLSENLFYFQGEKYNDENLNTLYSVINNYSYLLSRRYFLLKKKLLRYQEDLLK
jgi:Zn-dependent protease with chaperone function